MTSLSLAFTHLLLLFNCRGRDWGRDRPQSLAEDAIPSKVVSRSTDPPTFPDCQILT